MGADTKIPRLADLREPPVVGAFYLVPVVRDYPYCGRVDTWPVLGARHSDADFFSFPDVHYHVDARFLSKAQTRAVEGYASRLRPTVISIVGAYPLNTRGVSIPKGRPELARKKCTTASYGHAHQSQTAVQAMNAHYGAPAAAIRRANGQLLCPHRKVDLSQFEPDADGVVACPLHGLRVCVQHDRLPA